MMEWGILLGNQRTMNTTIMKTYLIRGADQERVEPSTPTMNGDMGS